MKIATVYGIKNLLNNDSYIGSTTQFNSRKHRHFYSLIHNTHHSIVLQRAYYKYGKDNFILFKIEVFPYFNKEDILQKEQYYIDRNNCKYNICKIAGSQLNSTRTDEFKQKCSELAKGRPGWNKGLHTMTSEQKMKMKIGREKGKKRIMTKELIANIIEKKSKSVLQFDIDGKFIKEWKSLKEVSINLPCSHGKLSEYMNGKSNISTFKNFIWKVKIKTNQTC